MITFIDELNKKKTLWNIRGSKKIILTDKGLHNIKAEHLQDKY